MDPKFESSDDANARVKWADAEKADILERLRNLHRKAPGLLDRVTAYRPLRLERAQHVGEAEWAAASARIPTNTVMITDACFGENRESIIKVLIHELTHLADGAGVVEMDPAWIKLVGAPMRHVQAAIREAGLSLPVPLQSREQAAEVSRRFDGLARKQGLPRAYAAKNLAESIAASVEAMLTGWNPPPAIRAYLETHFLSVPYRKTELLTLYHAGHETQKADEARDYFDRIIRLDPNFSEVYRDRAVLTHDHAAKQSYVAKYIDLAKNSPNRVADAYLILAGAALRGKDRSSAREHFAHAIQAEPDNPILYAKRAEFEADLAGKVTFDQVWTYDASRIDPAIADWTRVVKMAPDYVDGYQERADMLVLRKNLKEAELDLTRALVIDRNAPRLILARAHVRLLQGNASQAESDLRPLLQSNDPKAQRLKTAIASVAGRAQFELSNYRDAIQLFDAAEPNGFRPTGWVYRGIAYLRLGNYANAIKDLESALDPKPKLDPLLQMLRDLEMDEHPERGAIWLSEPLKTEAVAALEEARAKLAKPSPAEKPQAAPLTAPLSQDWRDCADASAIASGSERSISACTRITSRISEGPARLAVAFNNRGVAYAARKDFDRAIADFSVAIAMDPRKADAYVNRGIAYSTAWKVYDLAIADFDKAIALNPQDGAAYNDRGLAHESKGEHDRAIADYDKAIDLNKLDDRAYFNRGSVYHRQKGDLVRALADYEQAIRLNPKNAAAFNHRGMVYGAKGDHDRAIADFTESIRLGNPELQLPYRNRALAYSLKGDFEHAIDDYSKAIEIDPKFAEAFLGRGIAYMAKGESERAIADFNKVIELAPSKAQVYLERGKAYVAKKDYDRAIADLDKAIKLNPDECDAYLARGDAYAGKDDIDRAVTEFGEAIECDPGNARAYSRRGLAIVGDLLDAMLATDAEWVQAKRDFAKAIELDPALAEAYYGRAVISEEEGDDLSAIADYGKAIDLEPDTWVVQSALIGRAGLYKKAKNFRLAIADYGRLIEREPSAKHYNWRGEAYAANGEYDRAIADYDQAIELEPKFAVAAHLGRAWAYLKTGKAAAGLVDADLAVSILADGEAFYTRACIHEELGHEEEAIADFRKVVALNKGQRTQPRQQEALEGLKRLGRS